MVQVGGDEGLSEGSLGVTAQRLECGWIGGDEERKGPLGFPGDLEADLRVALTMVGVGCSLSETGEAVGTPHPDQHCKS